MRIVMMIKYKLLNKKNIMKKILITLAIAMTSIASTMAYNTWIPDGNDRIIGRCGGKFSRNKCRVDNPGKMCAQGKPGENIDLSKYDFNCK